MSLGLYKNDALNGSNETIIIDRNSPVANYNTDNYNDNDSTNNSCEMFGIDNNDNTQSYRDMHDLILNINNINNNNNDSNNNNNIKRNDSNNSISTITSKTESDTDIITVERNGFMLPPQSHSPSPSPALTSYPNEIDTNTLSFFTNTINNINTTTTTTTNTNINTTTNNNCGSNNSVAAPTPSNKILSSLSCSNTQKFFLKSSLKKSNSQVGNYYSFSPSSSGSNHSYTDLKSRSGSVSSLSSSTTSGKSVRFSSNMINIKNFNKHDKPSVVAKAQSYTPPPPSLKCEPRRHSSSLSISLCSSSLSSSENNDNCLSNSPSSPSFIPKSSGNKYLLFDDYEFDEFEDVNDLNSIRYDIEDNKRKNSSSSSSSSTSNNKSARFLSLLNEYCDNDEEKKPTFNFDNSDEENDEDNNKTFLNNENLKLNERLSLQFPINNNTSTRYSKLHKKITNKRRTSNMHNSKKNTINNNSTNTGTTTSKTYSIQNINKDYRWQLSQANFTNSQANKRFSNGSLWNKNYNVKLQSINIDEKSGIIMGKLHVLNLNFEKYLTIKYTMNQWKDINFKKATYSKTLDRDFDEFLFEFNMFDEELYNNNVKTKSTMTQRDFVKVFKFELCCKYDVNGQTYYDNNNYQNYKFDIIKMNHKLLPKSKLSKCWSVNDLTSMDQDTAISLLEQQEQQHKVEQPEEPIAVDLTLAASETPISTPNDTEPSSVDELEGDNDDEEDEDNFSDHNGLTCSSTTTIEKPQLPQRIFGDNTNYFNNNPLKHLYHNSSVPKSMNFGSIDYSTSKNSISNYKLDKKFMSADDGIMISPLSKQGLENFNKVNSSLGKSDAATATAPPSFENTYGNTGLPSGIDKYQSLYNVPKSGLAIDESLFSQIMNKNDSNSTITNDDTLNPLGEKNNNNAKYNDLLEKFCFFVPESKNHRKGVPNMTYD